MCRIELETLRRVNQQFMLRNQLRASNVFAAKRQTISCQKIIKSLHEVNKSYARYLRHCTQYSVLARAHYTYLPNTNLHKLLSLVPYILLLLVPVVVASPV